MKKTYIKQGTLAVVAVMSLLAIAPLTVNAEADAEQESTVEYEHRETTQKDAEARREAAQKEAEDRREAAKKEAENRREAAKTKVEAAREETKTRLSDTKLRVCQKHQSSITNAMARISNRGEKQLDLFSRIAERTQEFYVKKGTVLSNYDALVADVSTKKEAARAAITMIAEHSGSFECSSDDPKGSVVSFRDHQTQAIEALKEYKTSVKNLIVGVKSVQGVASSESERQ
ncbi:MAG: hypothetical protein WAZ21_04765 [Candidatus Saccharimonadales bacterium]